MYKKRVRSVQSLLEVEMHALQMRCSTRVIVIVAAVVVAYFSAGCCCCC